MKFVDVDVCEEKFFLALYSQEAGIIETMFCATPQAVYHVIQGMDVIIAIDAPSER